MRTLNSKRRMTWMLLMLLGLLVSASVAGAAPSSKAAKTQCQGAGYVRLLTRDGEPFRNAGECIRYVRDGGVARSAGRIDRDFNIGFDMFGSRWCEPSFRLYDFPAGTAVHVVIDGYSSSSGESGVWERNVVTDASGYANPGGGSVREGTTTVTATYTTPGSASVTVTNTFTCDPDDASA